jgi:hypothetical protein
MKLKNENIDVDTISNIDSQQLNSSIHSYYIKDQICKLSKHEVFLSIWNIKISGINKVPILTLKEIDKEYIIYQFKKFLYGILIYFILISFSIHFDYELIEIIDFPFTSKDSDYSKYFITDLQKDVAWKFNTSIIFNFPTCLDYVIWFIYNGISLTFIIIKSKSNTGSESVLGSKAGSDSNSNLIGFIFNIFFYILEIFFFINYFATCKFKENFEYSLFGLLNFSMRTFAKFEIQGIILNILLRYNYFLNYFLLKKSFFENKKREKIILLFILFPLLILNFSGLAIIIITLIVLSPYILIGFLFSLVPLLIITILGILLSGFILLPFQFLINKIYNMELNMKMKTNMNMKYKYPFLFYKNKSNYDNLNEEMLIENSSNNNYNNNYIYLTKKESKIIFRDDLYHLMKNEDDFNYKSFFNKKKYPFFYKNILFNFLIKNSFRLLFLELNIGLHFLLIIVNLSLQFSYFVFQSYNLFAVEFIFNTLPYYTINLFTFRSFYQNFNFYEIVEKINFLF